MSFRNVKFNKTPLLLILVFYLLFDCHFGYAQTVDSIVAIVNEDVITQSEVNDFLSLIYRQLSSIYKGEELKKKLGEAREKVLSQMIENRLILQEVKGQDIKVEDDEVDGRLEEVKNSFFSEEEFEENLELQGLTISGLRDRFREQIMVDRLIDKEVSQEVIVNPIEINKYYQEHIKDFQEQDRLSISQILIKVEDESREDRARLKAEDILNQLKDGADFTQLALRYSQVSGTTENRLTSQVRPGQLIKEIDEVIFNLEVGEISGLIRTKLGYHIFKVESKSLGYTKDMLEVGDKIRDILFRQKMAERFKEWISKLKEKAYIVISSH